MSQSAAPVRIRLRYADLDTFVERFAPNVTRGGVFLASRNVRAVGSTVAFEIQLVDGQLALAGEGKVAWVKQFDPAEPTRAYGMGVQFTSVDARTRTVLARLLRARETSGRAGERRVTGAFIPLDAAASVPPARGVGAGASGVTAVNGRLAPGPTAPVDTSVDLAAEYGLEEATLRRVVDRIWMLGTRFDSGDLDELLKPDPVEPVTLSQALTELPRLLDPQTSRRRMPTGVFRPLEMAEEPDDAERQDRSAKG